MGSKDTLSRFYLINEESSRCVRACYTRLCVLCAAPGAYFALTFIKTSAFCSGVGACVPATMYAVIGNVVLLSPRPSPTTPKLRPAQCHRRTSEDGQLGTGKMKRAATRIGKEKEVRKRKRRKGKEGGGRRKGEGGRGKSKLSLLQ